MVLVNDTKATLNTSAENVFVNDVYLELSLQSIMHMNGSSNINLSLIISKFRLEGDRHTFPSKWIYFSESFSNYINYSLGSDSWLFSQRFDARTLVFCPRNSN